ncbi:MAG: class I SAM-dependent methyltransferase [Gammaproteobacteria bacterium]
MSTKTIPLTDTLYQYWLANSLREPEVLAELRQETANLSNSYMQIAPEQGQFMRLLVELLGAKKTLELGVYTGYSALSVAYALPENGYIVACDVSEEWTNIAKAFWKKANMHHKIHLHIAPALQTLEKLLADKKEVASFDFAFIDADKKSYDAYYEKCLQLLRPGGLIAIDNVFQNGNVADVKMSDETTEIIRTLNRKILHDKRVSMSIVPIGDGLTLARKR